MNNVATVKEDSVEDKPLVKSPYIRYKLYENEYVSTTFVPRTGDVKMDELMRNLYGVPLEVYIIDALRKSCRPGSNNNVLTTEEISQKIFGKKDENIESTLNMLVKEKDIIKIGEHQWELIIQTPEERLNNFFKAHDMSL